MKDFWLILPIAVPMTAAILALLAYRSRAGQRLISVIGASILLLADIILLAQVLRHGILASQMGNWPAPYGITLVVDEFSAIMLLLTGLIGFAVVLYSLINIDAARESHGYHSLFHFLLMGVSGSFLTGDLFNLYVWFEVMLVASFVLMALGGERAQMAGAIKYVTLNLISSILFLTALGILYGLAGTLNMADLGSKFAEIAATQPIGVMRTLATLFIIAFGIKAATFPLFFWLPASYHTPPVAVSALFAGLLTKVGVYALIRVFTLIFVHDTGYTHTLILIIAGLTMITGVLGAVSQNEFRRILSFHIISQIGYEIMGLGLFSPLALAASIYFIAHHITAKTNLFLVSGAVQRLHHTLDLRVLGGLYRARADLAMLFLIPAMSLAGLPPLSGFFAKLGLVQAGLLQKQYLIVIVALAVSLLTLLSMAKIWNEAFWKDKEGSPDPTSHGAVSLRSYIVPIGLLAGITLAIGFAAGPIFALAQRAADQLANPSMYIGIVLHKG